MIIFFEFIKKLINLPKSSRILILLIVDLVSIYFAFKIFFYLTELNLIDALQSNLFVLISSIAFTTLFYIKSGLLKI